MKGKAKKPVYKSFLYLMPELTTAAEMSQQLDFISPDAIEIWSEINVLELTVDSRTITFECITEDLYEEDLALLGKISIKQVYNCEYAVEDKAMIQKVMTSLIAKFGGKIGSDTEDFKPFLKPENLG